MNLNNEFGNIAKSGAKVVLIIYNSKKGFSKSGLRVYQQVNGDKPMTNKRLYFVFLAIPPTLLVLSLTKVSQPE
jgi:hypothetical protein